MQTDSAAQLNHRELPGSYHAARRNTVLFGALLFFWQIVGLSMDADQEIGWLGVKIAAPEAIPLALIVLLGYFAVRYWIEWQLLDPQVRLDSPLLLDYRMTWVIGLVGLVVFAVQWAARTVDLLGWGQWLAAAFRRIDMPGAVAPLVGSVLATMVGVVVATGLSRLLAERAHSAAQGDLESQVADMYRLSESLRAQVEQAVAASELSAASEEDASDDERMRGQREFHEAARVLDLARMEVAEQQDLIRKAEARLRESTKGARPVFYKDNPIRSDADIARLVEHVNEIVEPAFRVIGVERLPGPNRLILFKARDKSGANLFAQIDRTGQDGTIKEIAARVVRQLEAYASESAP